jgi:hypothetical protein
LDSSKMMGKAQAQLASGPFSPFMVPMVPMVPKSPEGIQLGGMFVSYPTGTLLPST